MTPAWTTPAQVVERIRRRWTDGSLLRAYANGEPFPVIDLRVSGPKPSQIGDDLDAVRAWAAALQNAARDGRRYRLDWVDIGGRHIGRNRIPSRVVVSEYAQAWELLGTREAVQRFDALLALADELPAARAWVVASPHRALELGEQWPVLLAAYTWLDEHRGTGRYLREISAPGVDTKFAERHRSTLAAMLGVSATAAGFLAGLGLRGRPEFVRLRCAPGAIPGTPLTELAARAEELARLPLRPAAALVVENEVSYLSVPVPVGGVVLWGKGFEVDRVGRLPWLSAVDVRYWGDLDTHGFAILDRLRVWLPQTRSVLMDRATLIAHRDRWVREDRPASSRLTRLTPDERAVYDDLVTDRLSERVRLEQERIDWAWVEQHLDG